MGCWAFTMRLARPSRLLSKNNFQRKRRPAVCDKIAAGEVSASNPFRKHLLFLQSRVYKVGASENAHAQASSHEESHSRDSFRRDGVDFCRPAGLDGPTTRESTIRLPRARRR